MVHFVVTLALLVPPSLRQCREKKTTSLTVIPENLTGSKVIKIQDACSMTVLGMQQN
jgi:hypothetical protein